MKKITKQEAVKIILDETRGRFFAVTFIKRTNGEVRRLIGRRGVQKGVTGKGLAFDPASKGLCTVWDTQKKAFRMINLDSIISIRSNGQDYKVVKNV